LRNRQSNRISSWGSYIGFTFDSGELWWEGIIPAGETPDTSAKDYWTKYPFKIIAFNNERGSMNGCSSKQPDKTKTSTQP